MGKNVTIYMKPETLLIIDQVRGAIPRSTAIRKFLEILGEHPDVMEGYLGIRRVSA